MKKSWALFVFSITLLSFVSAYYGSYYGGGFSLSSLLDEIDSETLLLGVAFIVSFALINLSLSRVFKDNKAVPAVVAFCLALTIAWGINRSGYDLENLFYSLGFSSDFLSILLPLLIIGAFIFAVIKWGGNGFVAIGIILIAFGVIGFLQERFSAIFFGLVLIGIGWGVNKIFPRERDQTILERLLKRR